MAKKKKTPLQIKKEPFKKKHDQEIESSYRRCGLCFYIKIGLSDGTYVIHQTIDNHYRIYHTSPRSDSVICFSREEIINKDFLLPEGCPYTKLRPGYKTARIITQAEFDDIVNKELELGNYNILLADRVF